MLFSEEKKQYFRLFSISIFFQVLTMTLAYFFWQEGGVINYQMHELSSASRMANGLFTGLLTCMALIITLTANLYSPRLGKVFVKHSVVISSLSLIVACNILLLFVNYFSSSSKLYPYLLVGTFFVCSLTIASIIPFLYYVSQFIRPSYFIPLLTRMCLKDLCKITQGGASNNYQNKKNLFEMIEVMANICSTGGKRDDRSLMILTIKSIFEIHQKMIELRQTEDPSWRKSDYIFSSGFSEEGKFLLKKRMLWPEAFISSKVVRIINNSDHHLNEIVPVVCEKLIDCLQVAHQQNDQNLIELHLMVLNSFVNQSIQTDNCERFISLCDYYRQSIEMLVNNREMLNYSIKNFYHYCELTERTGQLLARESVLYDMGRILSFLAFQNEDLAIEFFKNYAGNSWKEDMEQEGFHFQMAWRSLVKTYWSLKAQGAHKLCAIIDQSYLDDIDQHLITLSYLLKFDRPLHREFNDRLVSPVFLDGKARELAFEFLLENIHPISA